MVDGKTQAFADLMIYNFEVVGGVALLEFVILVGVLALSIKMDLEDEPSD
jgi:hypothetical protein